MPNYGSQNADRYEGGFGGNSYNGLGGNDTIYGNAGNDYLDGGAGDDLIYGGAGNDTMRGGGGRDGIEIGAGRDTIIFDGLAQDGEVTSILLDPGRTASDDTLFFSGDNWFVTHIEVTYRGVSSEAWIVQWVEGWDMSQNDYGGSGINIEFSDNHHWWPA